MGLILNWWGCKVSVLLFRDIETGAISSNQRPFIGGLMLDCNVQETHSREATIPTFAVEEGFPISDHLIFSPKKLEFTSIVSASPLTTVEGAEPERTNRADDAWEELNRIFEEGERLEVVVGLDFYENMMITNLVAPRSARTGEALEVQISMREVRFADVEVITIEKIKPAQKRVAPRKDAGKVITLETTDGRVEQVENRFMNQQELDSFLPGFNFGAF